MHSKYVSRLSLDLILSLNDTARFHLLNVTFDQEVVVWDSPSVALGWEAMNISRSLYIK